MPLVLVLLAGAAIVAYFALHAGPADAAINTAPGGAALDAGADLSAASIVGQVDVMLKRVFSLPPAGAPYADAIRTAEDAYGIPQSLLARVLYQESRFRPDIISGQVKSKTGALGIAQFEPATAAELGVDPLNPESAIDGAGRYLRQLYNRFGDWSRALAAYNWGQGNLARRGLERAPAETRSYVADILSDVEV